MTDNYMEEAFLFLISLFIGPYLCYLIISGGKPWN